jgi:hypothetical protein
MDDLIANTTDPGVEALGARHELQTALIATPAAAPSAPADQTALRDRIAQALAAVLAECNAIEADYRDQHDEVAVGARAAIIRIRAQVAVLEQQPAVLPTPADQAASLSDTERQFLTFALDQAAEEMSLGDGFTDEDRAALEKLRRMAGEAQQPETQAGEAHPAEHTWAAELHDPLADEWVPGTRHATRDRAVNHLAHARTVGPTWKDGTPTQRRLVRATTTYTVEAEPKPTT